MTTTSYAIPAPQLGMRTTGCSRKNKKLEALLRHIETIHPKRIDLSLHRIRHLLASLGNPQESLTNVIHIAGTNGKGSTLAFLKACLQAQGRTVNRYTSPHIIHFNERIECHNTVIDDATLIEALRYVLCCNNGKPITFFEITTAVAFYLFHHKPADVTLIECGMGGRYDATNVISQPSMSIITSIAMDHQHYLGRSLLAIAREKAGILRKHGRCIIGRQKPAVRRFFETYSQEIGAQAYICQRDWHFSSRKDWHYCGRTRHRFVQPSLYGRHQYENAATAVACLDYMALAPLVPQHINTGMRTTRWLARLQPIVANPLNALLPLRCSLWLDGAHNDAAARALAINLLKMSHGEKWHVIFGMLASKNPKTFIKPLKSMLASLHAVAVKGDGSQARSSQDLAEMIGGIPQPSVRHAIEAIATTLPTDKPSYVLICGSLYLAADVLTPGSTLE